MCCTTGYGVQAVLRCAQISERRSPRRAHGPVQVVPGRRSPQADTEGTRILVRLFRCRAVPPVHTSMTHLRVILRPLISHFLTPSTSVNGKPEVRPAEHLSSQLSVSDGMSEDGPLGAKDIIGTGSCQGSLWGPTAREAVSGGTTSPTCAILHALSCLTVASRAPVTGFYRRMRRLHIRLGTFARAIDDDASGFGLISPSFHGAHADPGMPRQAGHTEHAVHRSGIR